MRPFAQTGSPVRPLDVLLDGRRQGGGSGLDGQHRQERSSLGEATQARRPAPIRVRLSRPCVLTWPIDTPDACTITSPGSAAYRRRRAAAHPRFAAGHGRRPGRDHVAGRSFPARSFPAASTAARTTCASFAGRRRIRSASLRTARTTDRPGRPDPAGTAAFRARRAVASARCPQIGDRAPWTAGWPVGGSRSTVHGPRLSVRPRP